MDKIPAFKSFIENEASELKEEAVKNRISINGFR